MHVQCGHGYSFVLLYYASFIIILYFLDEFHLEQGCQV